MLNTTLVQKTKNNKRTEGPWEFDGESLVYQENGPTIADVIYDPYANANLIAAAPELFDACELALRELGEFYNEGQSEALRTLKAAIKKANGKG